MSVIVTSNCFLIVILLSVKSTLEISVLGNLVYKVLSKEDWNCEVSILKLDGLIDPEVASPAITVGNPPSHIPATVVTPEIVKEC